MSTRPIRMIMLSELYQSHLKSQLTQAEYLLFQILITLLQSIKKVSLESLATALSTETEIITQAFKKIPRLRQISPNEGCVIIYSHPLTNADSISK